MARPRVHDERLRARLLELAGRTVAERGIRALTVRALAAAAGTSTTAVYSLFGGKPELLQELYRWAFEGFGAAQRAAASGGDALTDLHALGHAYRDWALAHPHLYAVMFGGLLTGVRPDEESEQISRATMVPLLDTVRRALDAGRFGHADADTIAFAVWAGVHGLVSLEMAAARGPWSRAERDAVFQAALHAIVRAWAV